MWTLTIWSKYSPKTTMVMRILWDPSTTSVGNNFSLFHLQRRDDTVQYRTSALEMILTVTWTKHSQNRLIRRQPVNRSWTLPKINSSWKSSIRAGCRWTVYCGGNHCTRPRSTSRANRTWARKDLDAAINPFSLAPRHLVFSTDPTYLFELFYDSDVQYDRIIC